MQTKVAVVQASSVLFDLEASLAKAERLVAQASGAGARLVLFPEAFLSVYPRGLSFGTVVGSREPGGRADWLLYHEHAVEVPGPAADYLGEIARRFKVWLVMGVTEKAQIGGTLYCTLLYYSPQGKLVQKHRKLKPTAAERIIWGEGSGDDLQAVDTPFGKIGGLICWENYMPLARLNLYQQGVEVYLAPTADQRASWLASMQHIACEGRCYVLSCNQMVRKEDYPVCFQAELAEQAAVMSRGGSLIVSPLGEVLAGPLFDEEGILYAEVDRREVIKAKLDFDPVGHYRRPDVFGFQWKQETKS